MQAGEFSYGLWGGFFAIGMLLFVALMYFGTRKARSLNDPSRDRWGK